MVKITAFIEGIRIHKISDSLCSILFHTILFHLIMFIHFILFLLLQMPWGMAQDERYFRQMFSGELLRSNSFTDEKRYSYVFHTPYYALDLNGDRNPEDS